MFYTYNDRFIIKDADQKQPNEETYRARSEESEQWGMQGLHALSLKNLDSSLSMCSSTRMLL